MRLAQPSGIAAIGLPPGHVRYAAHTHEDHTKSMSLESRRQGSNDPMATLVKPLDLNQFAMFQLQTALFAEV